MTASTGVGPLMWGLLISSGLLVLGLLFVVTLTASSLPQAVLMGMATMFTALLLLMVYVLSNPYAGDQGPLTPDAIEDNTARMVALAPEVAQKPCSFD